MWRVRLYVMFRHLCISSIMRFFIATLLALLPAQSYARWLGIPTVPFVESNSTGSFPLKQIQSIVIDTKYQDSVDDNGETLIPPTLLAFATTFAEDLSSVISSKVPISVADSASPASIFFTLGNSSDFVDAAGRPTSEGHSINITTDEIVITGASPLGAWWATRSILQQAVLQDNMQLPLGIAKDAPGWGVRGMMLDCGRHYYPPEFLVEMCSYLSFFKQNTFHLHLSDSPGVNADLSYEEKLAFYSAFRLNSPDPALAGLNKRPNESYYQEDFDNIQKKCASRGVTIIPEIEAPGHALVITQWKPELALSTDFTMLNISHPDTIPTMEKIWSTFLPWMHSKTVHLGADEYSSAEVAEYNRYVNTMHDYILQTFDKKVRIWGTFPPSPSYENNINTNVSIQHWEFFEDNPLSDYILKNYSVLNSDDSFYAVAKWSGSYPQSLNLGRVFHGAPDGGPFLPYIFDRSNAENNPQRNNPYVLGQMAALWNDFGPNSTSYIEAYYAVKEGLPALGDKQWGGNLLMDEYLEIFEPLRAAVPGQNLERRVESKTSTIFAYEFNTSSTSQTIEDKSGNGYDAITVGNCSSMNSSFILQPGCSVKTPLQTKGRNYTLSFTIEPTSSTPGPLFTGSSSSLLAGNGSLSNVMLITGGNAYVLNYTIPVNSWTDLKLIGIGNATYLSTTPSAGGKEKVVEFTITLGVLSNSFVWGNPMAIEAPIASIGGGNFEGQIKNVKLENGAEERYAAMVAPLVIGIAPYS